MTTRNKLRLVAGAFFLLGALLYLMNSISLLLATTLVERGASAGFFAASVIFGKWGSEYIDKALSSEAPRG